MKAIAVAVGPKARYIRMARTGARNLDRNTAIDRLRALEPELRLAGVEALYLFGSTARGEARAGSDVDLLDIVALRRRLERALGAVAHLTTRDGLHPLLKASIEYEAVSAF